MPAEGALVHAEKVDATLREGAFIPAAEVMPPKPPGSVGRPRDYPRFVWTLWSDLRPVFGTHRGVEAQLRRDGRWAYIRRELRRLHPDLALLPKKPPRRQQFEYWRDRYLAIDEGIERQREIHARVSTRQAMEAGNLDPNGAGSFTHPEPTRSLFGDGTIIKSLYPARPGTSRVDRATGEVRPVRFDPDARLYTEGGDKKVWGVGFAFLTTRRKEGRFILDVEYVERDTPSLLYVSATRSHSSW